MPTLVIPKVSEFRIRQEGDRVHVIADGQVVVDLPWDAAQRLWRAIRLKTLLAEEVAKRDQIARDSAILLRAGARMVLSSRADVKREATQLAAHDRDLRRYMPSIKSQESFGHPVIEVLPPKPTQEPT